jgi:glycosyltransferase involved in cell wall biosynthesis
MNAKNEDKRRIYVVIPTHGRLSLLDRTLKSLSQCERPSAYRAAYVVENGSNAGAEEIVEKYKDSLCSQYLYTPRGNKSNALNKALEQIERGLVVFFDDDVRLHPRVLEAYAEAASDIAGGAFFGGPTQVDYEEEPPNWMLKYLPASAAGWPRSELKDEITFLGVNWAAFAEDLEACGGFDPAVGPGTRSTGQETEMQQRLREQGAEGTYVPEALVWHYVPRSRCSPSWILDRAHRDGVGFGYILWDVDADTWGYPLWVWKGLLKRIGELSWAGLLGSRQQFFGARYQFQKYIGKMRGAKMRGDPRTFRK